MNFMGKRNKNDEDATPEDNPGEVRDIREEIRKRIEEAQRQRQDSIPEQPHVLPVEERTQIPVQRIEHPRSVHITDDTSARKSYRQMDLMRGRVDDLRAQADAAKEKAAAILKKRVGGSYSPEVRPLRHEKRRSRNVVREVIRELHDPVSARKAILNAEILGCPIGLRKPGQVKTSWEQ